MDVTDTAQSPETQKHENECFDICVSQRRENGSFISPPDINSPDLCSPRQGPLLIVLREQHPIETPEIRVDKFNSYTEMD
jgi:hypothetical protein